MRYVCLVYGDHDALMAMPEDRSEKLTRDSIDYDRLLEKDRHLIVAHALEPPARSTCLRTRGGRTIATDGPFSETKEQLLGFLLIEARDREQALALASKVPMMQYGSIEVRAVVRLEGETF